MNLLFINCKVADQQEDRQSKIIQFGYVLTDDALNIIKSDNFYINPGEDSVSINDAIGSDRSDFEKNASFYMKQPLFPNFYKEIVSLLTKENTRVIGWSIVNDLYALSSEFKRYGLSEINIDAFDLQTFYQFIELKYKRCPLEEAAPNLVYNEEQLLGDSKNNSESYSLLTLKVFDKLCEEKKISADEILSEITDGNCIVNLESCYNEHQIKSEGGKIKKHILDKIDRKGIKKYSFFDIECANCFDGDGKICEFGAVSTNLDFSPAGNPIHYLCNPGTGRNFRFWLKNRKGQVDIHLRFEQNDYEAYRKSPEFSQYIDNINYFFGQKNMLLFGFDVKNDLGYLDYSYRRYERELPNISVIDVRVLYEVLLKDKSSLEKIIETYVPAEERQNIFFHDSSHDAFATMLALKYVLSKFPGSLKDLIEKVGPDCLVNSSLNSELNKLNKKYRNLEKEIKHFNKINPFYRLKEMRKADKNYKELSGKEEFLGKRFGLSANIQHSAIDCLKLCLSIEAKGFLLALYTPDVDFLICKDENECRQVKGKIKREIKTIPLSEFAEKENIAIIENVSKIRDQIAKLNKI